MGKSILQGLLFLVSIIFFWSTVPVGCANIVPPSGGPRDTIPPRLLKVSPPDSTRNFHEKEITMTFDEFVDIKDPINNIIFTPTFNVNPEISARLKTIRIRFQEPLDSNTTYVLNFGNALVDVNENNPLSNFTYIFSTGPALDSLEIKGRVVLAENGGVDSTLTVILHRNLEDSAVRNERPPYAVKLNQNGEFNFRYLPSDTFAIYALGNAGSQRRYISTKELFAFSNKPVIAGETDSLILYAYRETPSSGSANTSGVMPSLGGRGSSASDRRLRFNLPQAAQDLKTDYIITFPVPLSSFDSSKVNLTTDSTFNPVTYTISLDTAKKELRFKTAWKEGTKYNLELQKEFATDTSGRQLLKTDTLFFTTKKRGDYGSVKLRIKNIDASKNPVLQFVQNNQVVFSVSVKSGQLTDDLFIPGEYSLRILYDTNDNGQWDPGKFFGERKQPELVHPINKSITVKPSWDNEFDISL